MAKFSLTQAPTFKGVVDVHVVGGEPCPLTLVFKYRTRTDLLAFDKSFPRGEDGMLNDEAFAMLNKPEVFMQFVSGWELEDEFTAENVNTLLENYYFVGVQAFFKYQSETIAARVKN